MLGKATVATSARDISTSTPMITAAITFSQFGLDHGPSTSVSLQSSSRKTVALGKRTPASACTEVVIRPSGAPGIRTIPAAASTISVKLT